MNILFPEGGKRPVWRSRTLDIGSKIKNARAVAGLTQEQAAERLDVSRQTVSNWETGKTYPDIVSVIKMSDLYNISLDRLLKEEKTLSDYIDYLDESTNVVKSKKRLHKSLTVLAYLLVWAFSVLTFWVFTSGSEAGAYAVLVIYLLIPLTTLAVSAIIGRNNFWGKFKWLTAPLMGIMHCLLGTVTFDLANTVSVGRINSPEWIFLFIGSAVSLVGLALGTLVRFFREGAHK